MISFYLQGSCQPCDAYWICERKEQPGRFFDIVYARNIEVWNIWKVHVLKGQGIENKEKGFPCHGIEWVTLKIPFQGISLRKFSSE